MREKIKNFWEDLDKDGRRWVKLLFYSAVAITIMALLKFYYTDIIFFMTIGWLIYSIARTNELKEEKERIETELFLLNQSIKHREKEVNKK